MPLSTRRHHVPQLRLVTDDCDENVRRSLRLWTVMSYASLLAFASLVALGWQPALRFQPTIVGVVWACLFLSGYMLGGVGRGQFSGLLLAVLLIYLSWLGFRSLTDLGAADCLLLVTVLVVGGWGASMWRRTNDPIEQEQKHQNYGKVCLRWSIWDLGFVTTIVACFAHAAPRLATPAVLMFAVSTALFSGLLLSWIACSWVWHDQWNWWSMSALLTTVVGGVAVVHLSAPSGLSLFHTLQWALSGPVNVIASQGVAVLAVLFIWRLDQHGLVGKPLRGHMPESTEPEADSTFGIVGR